MSVLSWESKSYDENIEFRIMNIAPQKYKKRSFPSVGDELSENGLCAMQPDI